MLRKMETSERVSAPGISRKAAAAGQAAVFLCAVFWSTSGVLIKLLDWNPVTIAGLRSLLAACCMIPARLLIFPKQRIPWKRPAFWFGGFFYALTLLLFVIANKLTSSANAIILEYSAPAWAALFSWLIIKERPTRFQLTAIVLVVIGLYTIFGRGMTAGNTLGDALAILSGVTFGLNTTCLRMQKEANPIDSMWLSHAMLGIGCLPFYFIAPPSWTLPAALSLLFLGVVQSALASFLYGFGLKRVSAVRGMLTASVEPVLNPVWVFLFIGEAPSRFTLAGGVIILAAVILAGLPQKQK
jgi:drug/metabolite transporter (DMT)-like permease